ncbi:MAG TPA: DinB family protein [Gemmatimonadales bacterium]|nr:DinB family protein [Gemmatimonadales bacterium]
MTTASLHPRLAELVELLETSRAELLAVVATVTPDEAVRSPGGDAWSVAQIAEHLRLVESGIVRGLRRTADAAGLESLAPETETSSVLGALDRYRFEERRSRLPAPPGFAPAPDASLPFALTGLEQARRDLLALIERLNGRALAALQFPHPALGPFSCYQWILFVAQHERRHAAQMREALVVLRAGGGPGTARSLSGAVLAAATALAAAATLSAQAPPQQLPYESMARRITTALQPARGERAILRSDGVAMPEIVAPLRAALEAAGVEVAVVGFGADVDLLGEQARSSIYVYLPLAPGNTVPPADADALGKWLDSGKGRQVHFHWTGITTGTDGDPIAVPPSYDRMHLAALDADEAAMRHRLTRAAELLRNREIRVATPAGTDLRFRIGNRAICLQDGNASQAAVKSKPLRIDKEVELPAGVLRVAPLEESVNGTLAIPLLRVGTDTARMVQLDFANGRVTDVRAEAGADAVRAMLAKSPALSSFRELGIGFNPALVVPQDQPAIPYAGYGAGMVRLSLGDNRELGGSVSGGTVRWLFFPDATVTAGTTVLVAGGRLLL